MYLRAQATLAFPVAVSASGLPGPLIIVKVILLQE